MIDGKITELLQTKGMEYDETSASWYGTVSGYAMKLEHYKNSKNYELVVPVTNGGMPDKQTMKEIAKQIDSVAMVTVKQYTVRFFIKMPLTSGALLENISAAISAVPEALRNSGWTNCCEASGRTDNLLFGVVGGEVLILTDEEYGKREIAVKERRYTRNEKGENVIGGIVGAFLGSIIGLIVIVLVGQLGYVAVLSGIVMGVCTVKGYALLGGKLSKKGAVLSFIIMVCMTFAAFILDTCVYAIRKELGGFEDLELMVRVFIKTLFIEPTYVAELIKLFAFTLVGAVPAMLGAFKDEKLSMTAYKLKNVRNDDEYGF